MRKQLSRNFLGVLVVLAGVIALLPVFGALTSSVQISVGSNHTATVGLSTAQDPVAYNVNKTFSNGTGTTQVGDLVYHASRSLTTGASETLDLYGTLTDAFGNTLSFARVKCLVIENTSASMTLTIGSSTNPLPIFSPATATLDIKPSGVAVFVFPLAGVVVTDASADSIKVLNSAGSTTTYKIWVQGSST